MIMALKTFDEILCERMGHHIKPSPSSSSEEFSETPSSDDSLMWQELLSKWANPPKAFEDKHRALKTFTKSQIFSKITKTHKTYSENVLNKDALEALKTLKGLGLKVGVEFSKKDIKKEWRRLVLQFHPDRGIEKDSTKMLRLQRAYLLLNKFL